MYSRASNNELTITELRTIGVNSLGTFTVSVLTHAVPADVHLNALNSCIIIREVCLEVGNDGTLQGAQQGVRCRIVQQLVAHQGAQDPVLRPALASRHHWRLLELF